MRFILSIEGMIKLFDFRQHFLISCSIFFLLSFSGLSQESSLNSNPLPKITEGFLENKGQMIDNNGNTVNHVLFKLSSPELDFYITEKGATYVFKKNDINNSTEKNEMEGDSDEDDRLLQWERIDLILKSATINKNNVVKELPTQAYSNYYLPHCPNGIKKVKKYRRVTIKDVYPGIDWVFYNSTTKGYKYDFVVHSSANADDIELIYRGKNKLSLTEDKGILIKTDYGDLKEEAPKSFLNKKLISSEFVIQNISQNKFGGFDNLISFRIPERVKDKLSEQSESLIIDPQLAWATYYGGNYHDGVGCNTTNNNGDLLVAGESNSTNFPTQDAGTYFQGLIAGSSYDLFILKLDNNANIVWSTYYGGAASELARSMSTDNSDNIFVTGSTSSTNFPTQNTGTFHQTYRFGGDAFILKFDNNGNRLWGTFYGGLDSDVGSALTIDNNNNVYVVGQTKSINLPTQSNGTFFQSAHAGGISDAFILKFDNNGNRLWATYYGGNDNDYFESCAIDKSDNLFIIGTTYSDNFPTQNAGTYFDGTGWAKKGTLIGGSDALILKFDKNGNRLWGTYYAGSAGDIGASIVVDDFNNIFVSGRTFSTNLPTKDAGTYMQSYSGGFGDAFISKFDNSGNHLWGTYYGGSGPTTSGSETSEALSIDKCNNIFWLISTNSNDLKVLPFCKGGYFQNKNNGSFDHVLLKFTNQGNLIGGTYFGGEDSDATGRIAIDKFDNLWLTGKFSLGLPTSTNKIPFVDMGGGAYFDNSENGRADLGMVKFTPIIAVSSTTNNPASCSNCDGSATVAIDKGCAPYDYIWANGSETLASSDAFNTITDLCPGTYPVQVITECDTLYDTVYVAIDLISCDLTITMIDTNICAGECVDIIASTFGTYTEPIVYEWDNGIVDSDSVITVCPSTTTAYTVIGTDDLGHVDTTTVVINVVPSPEVDLGTDTIICGKSYILDAENPGNTFIWNNDSNNQTLTVDTSGTYWVIINNGTCMDSSGVNVTLVNDKIDLGADTTICFGQIITIDAGIGDKYLWSDGSTLQTLRTSIPGTYWVEVLSNICSQKDSIIVNTENILASFISSDTDGCSPLTIDFDDLSLMPTGTKANWEWSFGDGEFSNLQNTRHTYLYEGSYDVQLTITSSNGCQGDTTINSYINVFPNASASFIYNYTSTLLEKKVDFINKSTNATSWVWDFGDGYFSTDENPSHEFNELGTYNVTLIAKNEHGCEDTIVYVLNIESELVLFAPNAFTPDGMGGNNLWEYYLHGFDSNQFYVQIFNRWGELLWESSVPNEPWDGRYLGELVPQGMYVWKMECNEATTTRRLSFTGHVSVLY